MAIKRLLLLALLGLTACGESIDNLPVTDNARPLQASVARSEISQQLSPQQDKQILFGDLHVHTTYSMDAYEKSMSIADGEGAHPPADACDFARFCSQLDFWSINDHAEFLTPERWRDTKESIRQCNAVAEKTGDMVSFLGWEWTQIGTTADNHFGHKNVVLADIDEASVPARPIHSQRIPQQFIVELDQGAVAKDRFTRPFRDPANFREHLDYIRYAINTFSTKACDTTLKGPELPSDCSESAATPKELFERLAEWQSDYLVIPHGNSWGLYTPTNSSWHKQLTNGMKGEKQTLIEVFSGHGNSEQYRPWLSGADANGECPAPTENYEPCCWRAGEIVKSRCDDPGSASCNEQVAFAKQNYLAAGNSGHLTLSGVEQDEWKNCGQCEDCFLPAFNFRPGTSAQAALASTAFDENQENRFRFGFIASSDNHTARPGTGYKEYRRIYNTDRTGYSEAWKALHPKKEQPFAIVPVEDISATTDNIFDRQRTNSFYYTGGLVAVHSEGRDRDSIWSALTRKEVYGTSGPRLLLWFDLLEGEQRIPMGSQRKLTKAPEFSIKALGSFVQKPGCPAFSEQALSSERLSKLCMDECYHPSEERHRITHIEVVKVRPQSYPGEPLAGLIEDPWRRFECDDLGDGCEVNFSDPDYSDQGRDAVYYARAIQEATPAINGGNLRCEYDDQGQCIALNPCHGDNRTDSNDDCLAPTAHRAWSSPIFVDYPRK